MSQRKFAPASNGAGGWHLFFDSAYSSPGDNIDWFDDFLPLRGTDRVHRYVCTWQTWMCACVDLSPVSIGVQDRTFNS